MSEGWRFFILLSLPQHSPLQQALLHKHQRTRTQTHPRHTQAHRHTTHAFRSSATQLWLGPQATEQHASLSISTAPRRPLKPNFWTYLVCQLGAFPCCDQDMGVVVKTWVWWSYLRNLQATIFLLQEVTVARQRSTRSPSTETFSVDLRIRAHCQDHVFGGVQSWSLYSENCRENVDAALGKKFRNLNEKM